MCTSRHEFRCKDLIACTKNDIINFKSLILINLVIVAMNVYLTF